MTFIWSVMGLALGGCIGYGFGLIQDAALRRHERRQAAGEFKHGVSAIAGSMRRVVYLVLALTLVQVLCPMLFTNGGYKWWVSGGLVFGYGVVLSQQLRRRLLQSK